MSKTDERDERRQEYVERTPRILVRARSLFGGYDVSLARMGEVIVVAPHDVQQQRLTSSGFTPLETVRRPETVAVQSRRGRNFSFLPKEATKAIRRMSAADSRRYDTLTQRILKLERERRDLVATSWDRAIAVSEKTLRDAGAKNRSARERGYPRPRRTKAEIAAAQAEGEE